MKKSTVTAVKDVEVIKANVDVLANPLRATLAEMANYADGLDEKIAGLVGTAGEYALAVLKRKAAGLAIDGLTGRGPSRKLAGNFQSVYNALEKAGFTPADIIKAATMAAERKIPAFGSGSYSKALPLLLEKGLLSLSEGQKAEQAEQAEQAKKTTEKQRLQASLASEAVAAEKAVESLKEGDATYKAGQWIITLAKKARLPEFSGEYSPEQLETLAVALRQQKEAQDKRLAAKEARTKALDKNTKARHDLAAAQDNLARVAKAGKRQAAKELKAAEVAAEVAAVEAAPFLGAVG